MRGVVEEAAREGEVSSLNPTGREVRDFTWKNARFANRPSLGLNLFFYF
jgi:hypothetical protein